MSASHSTLILFCHHAAAVHGSLSSVVPLLDETEHVLTIDVGMYFDDGNEKNTDLTTEYGLDLMTSGVPAIVVLDQFGRTVATTRDSRWKSARRVATSDIMPFLEGWIRRP